jgi:hypothetical protein
MKKIILTQHEWYDSMKTPGPHRNRKKYYRKEKHKKGWSSNPSFVYLQSK